MNNQNMTRQEDYKELANVLIDKFLSLNTDTSYEAKCPIIEEIIETFGLSFGPLRVTSSTANSPIDSKQLYTLFEHTLIIPEIKTLLICLESNKFTDLLKKQRRFDRPGELYYNGDTAITMYQQYLTDSNIVASDYNCIKFTEKGFKFNELLYIHYQNIEKVVTWYATFFKELLVYNKLMFVALVRYFNDNEMSSVTSSYQDTFIPSQLDEMLNYPKFKMLIIFLFFDFDKDNKLLLGIYNEYTHYRDSSPYQPNYVFSSFSHMKLLTYEVYPIHKLYHNYPVYHTNYDESWNRLLRYHNELSPKQTNTHMIKCAIRK